MGKETAKTQVGNILAKLYRAQTMIYALEQGLVAVDDLRLE